MEQQTQQVGVEEISDLQLAQFISSEKTKFMQAQINLNVLEIELNRRLKLAAEKEKEQK